MGSRTNRGFAKEPSMKELDKFCPLPRLTATPRQVDQSATNSGGVLASYRFFFNAHHGVEAIHGYAPNTQNFLSIVCIGSSGKKIKWKAGLLRSSSSIRAFRPFRSRLARELECFRIQKILSRPSFIWRKLVM